MSGPLVEGTCAICEQQVPRRKLRKGRCVRCYQYYWRHRTERPRVLTKRRPRPAPRPPVETISGDELRRVREAWGWGRRQVEATLHYSRGSMYHWERGTRRVPPDVAVWARALRLPPCDPACAATPGALLRYLDKHRMRCIELGDFIGVHESTVERWIERRTPIPPVVQVWLRAGCPPYWNWGPPGPEERRFRYPGKPLSVQPRLRANYMGGRPHKARIVQRWKGKRAG